MRIQLDMRGGDVLHEQSGEIDSYTKATCIFCNRTYSDHPDYEDIPDDECCPVCTDDGYTLPGEMMMEE